MSLAIGRYFENRICVDILVNYLLWLVVILTVVAFSLTIPHFMSLRNAENIVTQVSITGILAIGMTYVIISGGIDLSVGSTLGLSAIVTGLIAREQYGLWLPLAGGILTGVLIGFVFNGAIAKVQHLLFIVLPGCRFSAAWPTSCRTRRTCSDWTRDFSIR